jgi:hypothetical protein
LLFVFTDEIKWDVEQSEDSCGAYGNTFKRDRVLAYPLFPILGINNLQALGGEEGWIKIEATGLEALRIFILRILIISKGAIY